MKIHKLRNERLQNQKLSTEHELSKKDHLASRPFFSPENQIKNKKKIKKKEISVKLIFLSQNKWF